MNMQKKIYSGILAFAGIALWMSSAQANKNFMPDSTFKGSSLGKWRTVGGAEWRAENGEIVGTPKTAEGGWLIMDTPLQDTQFAANYRCTGGCKAGVAYKLGTTLFFRFQHPTASETVARPLRLGRSSVAQSRDHL
jgi:hypothetical protein